MTADGLQRVPSRQSGGVFRLPGAPFIQYRLLILEPVTVSFIKDWERNHRDVSEKEQRRIRDEAAKLFREEFELELIERGKYKFAQDPGADVLVVAPAITEKQSLSPRSIALRMTGELRDAASGKLVGRVDMFRGGEEYRGLDNLRGGTRTDNAFEIRGYVRDWARLLREALNVAKTERRR
jgi:hypothetical protein